VEGHDVPPQYVTFAGKVSADIVLQGSERHRQGKAVYEKCWFWRWSVVGVQVHARKDMEGQLDAWWGN
jgi:hypothetical protein